ncbi:uncharacterized protein VICG_00010 [Vittaforma corneae ATCC 50505]|uniref:DNA mismatch repair protein MutS core domain-containing protein n=1 Tax=Vittaforma corneae (strain ATCC 50505) TaxID=993615 RepID=L2GQC6_VITCO|nr:uncharacterized protein VICG_00010 [Vittaforma corneae ATCC 50505]ELA42695.1 hypothetical protein VICG_00010 [Vittaforma corneae ATCC 50505]
MPWYCTLYLKEDTAVDVSCYYSKECTDDYRRWICKRHSENDNYDSSSYLFSTTNYSVKNEILPELFKKYISMSNSNYNNIIVSFICNLREITSLLVQYVHSGNSSYFFISNPEFSEALAKNTNLESAVCLCYSFGNKNSSSVLISYLEINGVVVEHAPSDKYTGIYNTIEPFDNYNWDVAYGRSTSIVDNKQHLLIYGIQSSLFHSINQTATNLGKRKLLRRITDPPDHSWIQTSLNFIQKFRNNPIIQKVSELLKKINAFDIKATERINDIELGTSFLMDQSTNDSKSIYSRNNLEESSILKYKKIVKNVENIKNNMEIFNVLKKEIEKTNTEEGIFGDLIEALSETSTIERIDTQFSVINCKAECVYPFLADRIGFVVKSGVDSYLDLCRGMYEEKLLMCQDVLNKIQSVYDLEIYFGDDREICLMKTNSHERNEAKMKRNATVEHKSSYRSSSTMLDKVGTFQNRPSKKKRRINSSKAIKLFVLKESKTMILYSCPELKALNKLIRELLDQIIEIEGRFASLFYLKSNSMVYFLQEFVV